VHSRLASSYSNGFDTSLEPVQAKILVQTGVALGRTRAK
jgi:hypothetical protein